MKRNSPFAGFRVTSLIYSIFGFLLASLGILTFIDFQYELELLGVQIDYLLYADGKMAYEGYFGYLTSDGDTVTGFINVGGYVFIVAGIIILIGCLLSLILVSINAKKESVKRIYMVPSLVVGILFSVAVIGLPLLIATLLSMHQIASKKTNGAA